MKTIKYLFLGAATMLGFISPLILEKYFAGNTELSIHIFYLAIIANLLIWFSASTEMLDTQLKIASSKEELEGLKQAIRDLQERLSNEINLHEQLLQSLNPQEKSSNRPSE